MDVEDRSFRRTVRSGSLLLLFVGCSAPDTSGIRLVGHGGLGPNGDHPMDTREALLGALERGMDGVEMDVQLTQDSVLVAFHDLDLAEKTACEGPINSHTWDQLKNCTDEERNGDTYPIVRLDSLLLEATTKFPKAEFTFDIKLNTKGEWWPYLHAFTNAISKLAMHPEAKNRIVIECQTKDFLQLMHDEALEIPLFLYGSEPQLAIELATELGCTGITMDNDRITAADVAGALDTGLQVTLFGISGDGDLRSAADKKPGRIQLDHDH